MLHLDLWLTRLSFPLLKVADFKGIQAGYISWRGQGVAKNRNCFSVHPAPALEDGTGDLSGLECGSVESEGS
jgi:hypothetical protein